MIQKINKLLDGYIFFINKKPAKQIITGLLFCWTGIIAICYFYNYGYFYPIFVISWVAFILVAIITLILGFKKFISVSTLIDFLSRFFKKKEYDLKFKHLFVLFFALVIITANAFLFILSAQKIISTELSFGNIINFEVSIFQKTLALALFYFLLALLVYALGKKLLRLFKINFDSKLELFVFSVGAGFVPIMFGTFFIALAGRLYGWAIWLMIIILAGFSFSELKNIVSDLKQTEIKLLLTDKSSVLKILVFLLLFIILAFNFVVITKPLPITTDDLHTYFNSPDLFVFYHKYKPLMHIPNANMGQNTEMIYAAILSVFNPKFIIHFQFFSFILCLISFYVLIKRGFSQNHAFLALFCIFFVPWNFYYTSTVKVEFFMAFYMALIALSLFSWWRKKENHSYLYLFGFFSGIALGIKYTAALLVFPLLIFLGLYFIFNIKNNLRNIKSFLISIALLIIFFSPWIIKNIYYFNNPLYPFQYFTQNKINEKLLNSQKLNQKERAVEIKYLRHSLEKNKYSLRVVFNALWNQSVGRGTNSGNWINFGFIPILIIPFYILALRDKKMLGILFIIFLYFLFWYVLGGARVWYAFFGVMALYALLPSLLLKNKYFLCLYAVFSLFIVVISSYIIPHNINYLIGSEDVEAYKYNTIPYIGTAEYINKSNLSSDEKILLLLDFRAAFINRNDELTIVDPYLSLSGYALSQGLDYYKKSLDESSIKYIIYSYKKEESYRSWLDNKNLSYEEYLSNYKGATPSIYKDIETLKNFLGAYGQLLFDDGYYKLYKIN